MMFAPPAFRVRRVRAQRRGFALIIVLIIMSVLALVAVGYLSSMSQERATANAFANKARAEQSAQAGVDTAMGVLRDYFKAFPDSATVWDPTQSTNPDGSHSEGTTLYLRAVPQASHANLPEPAPGDPTANLNANYTAGNGPSNGGTTGTDGRSTFVMPLVSGATVNLLASKSSTVPALTADTSINLNARRQLSDTQGWLGTPPNYTSAGSLPKPVYVPWVNIQQQDGYTGNASAAPVVERYAFWVEDESFRANVSYAGTGTAPGNVRRDNPANYALNPTDINLIGTLTAIGDPSPATVAQNLVTARNLYPGGIFPEARAYAHSTGLSTPTANGLRYITTPYSAALNLSRHGTQRLNLNDIIYPPNNAANGTTQNQIDKIVQTIQFHAPNFGQRFYRNNWSGNPPVITATDLDNATMVTSANAQIYLYKIAANVHDYIDADALPTVIDAVGANGKAGQVYAGGAPVKPMNFNDGANPEWAVGKDSAPVMEECAVRFSTPGATSGRYAVNVDYYIEFWNMSTRQVTSADLGPHPYIRINDAPSWYGTLSTNPTSIQATLTDDAGTPSLSTSPPARDGNIDLSQAINPDGSSNGPVIFPPGSITVITTDPNYATVASTISDTSGTFGAEAVKHYFLCAAQFKRSYAGTLPSGCNSVRMLNRNSGGFTSGTDYETEVVVGNDNGYLESLGGGISMNGGIISFPPGTTALRPVYGGYLRGNLASGGGSGTGLQPSAIGDPRTNNEQLIFSLSGTSSVDATRYKNFDLPTTASGIPPSFGLPNFFSIDPAKAMNPWPDYYYFPHSLTGPAGNSTANPALTAQNAPSVIANAPLLSVGQLGDIYDPARLPSVSGGDVTASRGGGRSLRVGQHDDRFNIDPPNNDYKVVNATTGAYPPSAGWASWRLADFFSISNSIEQAGLININGLARDNGAALLAAFQGFNFQTVTRDPSAAGYDATVDPLLHGDPQTAGKALDTTGLQNLIADIISNRLNNTDLTKPGPFFERGEISETPILNPATSTTALVTGVSMKTVLNGTREELVRRLIELTTTRGNVFTVYAVGQAVKQTAINGSTKTNVLATHQLRVTFKLVPKTSAGKPFQPAIDAPGDDFIPTDNTQLNTRFAKPDHYDIQVLSVTSGNG